MKIKVKEIGLTKIMFLEPQSDEEEELLTNFCRIDTPLEATIIQDHIYKNPHIEIRKEA